MQKLSADLLGAGITTLTFSVFVNVLSANFPFCLYQQAGRVVEMESTLTFAENVNIVLPTALIYPDCNLYSKSTFIGKSTLLTNCAVFFIKEYNLFSAKLINIGCSFLHY
jgi:hypothetical protein